MSGQWHGGKGSKPRPLSVSQEQFDATWDTVMKQPSLREQYDNYVVQATELGWDVKTFAEWLHS